MKQQSKSFGLFTVLALFAVAGAAWALFFRRPAQETRPGAALDEQNPAADWQAESGLENKDLPGVDPVPVPPSPSREPH